ncbi:MAG: HD domain-containing protein [Oscillospiraceae bacterium]
MEMLTKAVCFAAEKHEGQSRKGTNIPYITHPMEAAAIAATLTDDEEIIAAAVLHDVAEDCGVTAGELEASFGERTAALVAADSEDKRDSLPPADTWKIRKEETVARITKMDRDEKIIVLAEKLSNMRSIYRDYAALGDNLWKKFNCSDKKEQGWYYKSICAALKPEFEGAFAWQELSWLTSQVFD